MGDRRRSEAAFLHALELAETHRTKFPEIRGAIELLANINLQLGDEYQAGSCGLATPRLQRARAL